MALSSFSFQPLIAYESAWRPILYKATSNHADIIYVKITISVDGSDITTSHVLYPDAGTANEFTIDIKRYIQQYLDYTWGAVDSATVKQGDHASVYVKFEEYVDTTGVPATTSSIITSNTKKFVSVTVQHTDAQTLDKYIADDSAASWLTNRPDYTSFRLTDSGYIYIINPSTAACNRVYFSTYDGAGSLLKAGYFTISKTDLIGIPCAPANMNAATVTFSTGSGTPIDTNVVTYKINMALTSDSKSSAKWFKVDQKCKYQNSVIHFGNPLGGIDSFNFQHEKERRLKVRRSAYSTPVTNTNMTWNVDDRGDTQIIDSAKVIYKLKSGILTEAQAIWLEDLKASTDVKLQDGSNYIPINIINFASVTTDTTRRMYRCEIEYEHANQLVVQ